jgi:hypothetical protein
VNWQIESFAQALATWFLMGQNAVGFWQLLHLSAYLCNNVPHLEQL